jgi:hypothetical protein
MSKKPQSKLDCGYPGVVYQAISSNNIHSYLYINWPHSNFFGTSQWALWNKLLVVWFYNVTGLGTLGGVAGWAHRVGWCSFGTVPLGEHNFWLALSAATLIEVSLHSPSLTSWVSSNNFLDYSNNAGCFIIAHWFYLTWFKIKKYP